MRGYKFSVNEEVAHIANLTNKMIVVELKWRTKEKFEGQSPDVKKIRSRSFDGCVCQWWMGPELKQEKFHAELLVPWWCAVKGQKDADEWLEQMKTEKYVIKSKD